MKVAVVANGSSLRESNLGKEIDQYDTVIRMNEYYRLIDENITGLKCDIWSCCFNNNCKYDDQGRAKEVWVARPEAWDKENHSYWTVPASVKSRVTHHVNNYDAIQDIIKKNGGCNPTTGFITLWTALNDKFKEDEIHVYGYDFYKIAQCYYEPTPQCRFVHHHSPDAEKKQVKKWVEEKRITYHGTL